MVANATLATLDNQSAPAVWIKIPVFSVLIDNPERGWILYDTGCHPDGMKGRWSPSSLKVAPHTCTEDQLLVNQLKKLGLKPEDIKTVILSHMHCDHAGGLFLFKDKADVYVNKTDLMNALFLVYSTQDPNATGGTCKADVIEPVQKYHFFGNKDIEFAPGIELFYTPGHTAGLMALLLRLEKETYLFPGDSLNLALNYGPPARVSGVTQDTKSCFESIEKIRELQEKNRAKLIYPHDIAQFKTLKLAPEYYE
jgi:glyoxylase-like metal-dependent hydrolase (beta-lactamase superfamily II)